MQERERLIRAYFKAWLDKDASVLGEIFESDVEYSECYGPVYKGLTQVQRWFADWNRKGSVLKWNIRRFYHAGDTVIADWDFRCDWEGIVSGFDGVSIVDFSPAGKIARLREFESKSDHVYPYGE